jgi:hypothetical protein
MQPIVTLNLYASSDGKSKNRGGGYDATTEVRRTMRKPRRTAEHRQKAYRQLLGYYASLEDPDQTEFLSLLEDAIASSKTESRKGATLDEHDTL